MRKRRSFGGMGFLFKAAFTVVAMVALAIGAISFLVPGDAVSDRVASLVKQKTGRDLTIRGKTSFSVFPNIGVKMADVSMSNPPGMPGENLLSMSSLNINLKLLPLLSRRVEVGRFVFVQPVFNLQVDGAGRKKLGIQKVIRVIIPNPSQKHGCFHVGCRVKARVMMQAQAGGIGGSGVKGISLGTVEILDGTLIYTDKRAGAKQRLDTINVTLKQLGLNDPLITEGSLRGAKKTSPSPAVLMTFRHCCVTRCPRRFHPDDSPWRSKFQWLAGG